MKADPGMSQLQYRSEKTADETKEMKNGSAESRQTHSWLLT